MRNQEKLLTKVVVFEHLPLFGKGLSALLQSNPHYEWSGTTNLEREAIHWYFTKRPDVIILDWLPKQDQVLGIINRLRSECPGVKILLFSLEKDIRMIIEALDQGIKGCLDPYVSQEEVLKAVDNIKLGKTYLSESISKRLGKLLPDHSQPFEQITRRELDILKGVYEELTNKEIADRLFISPRTVDAHKRNLMKKLKVRNSVGLAKVYLSMVSFQMVSA